MPRGLRTDAQLRKACAPNLREPPLLFGALFNEKTRPSLAARLWAGTLRLFRRVNLRHNL
jgi:hypothetical protein